jgi:glutamate--cysteine ligase
MEKCYGRLSMPPKIADESSINIATYGKSNMGRLKHVYRKGLAIRYGKTMQCVSGIHYNFSLSDKSLKQLGYSSQNEKNKAYLNLIRNFKRLFWFVLIEFGNSPVVDKSFVAGRANDLDILNETDLFKPYATSLRMSDIGYQSKAQKNLNFKYNDLDEFLSELRSAIINPYPDFEDLGLKDIIMSFNKYRVVFYKLKMSFMTALGLKEPAKAVKDPTSFLKNKAFSMLRLEELILIPMKLWVFLKSI